MNGYQRGHERRAEERVLSLPAVEEVRQGQVPGRGSEERG